MTQFSIQKVSPHPAAKKSKLFAKVFVYEISCDLRFIHQGHGRKISNKLLLEKTKFIARAGLLIFLERGEDNLSFCSRIVERKIDSKRIRRFSFSSFSPFFFISPIKHGTPPFWKRRLSSLYFYSLKCTRKVKQSESKVKRKARFVILRFESKPAASRNFNRGENATDLCKFARCPPRRVFTLGSVQPDYLENASHTSSILLERKCTDIDGGTSTKLSPLLRSFIVETFERLKKRKTTTIWLLIIHVKISSKLKILPHLRDLQNLIGILIIISNCKFSFLANNSCKIIDLSLVTILVTVALRLSREHGHHHTVMVVVASFAVAIIGRNITKYFASPGGAAAEIAGQFHGHKGKFTGM